MDTQKIESELLFLTEELIRIPSTHSRPEQILHCADFIENWLGHSSIKCKRYIYNNVPSIAVLPQKSSKVKILFMAHFDVVEAENATLFSPYIKNGNLYGRGAIDDKYAVALLLVLFREQLNCLKKIGLTQDDMDFGLLLTGDEEVGGWNGVGIVNKKIDTEFGITLDGGNPGLIVTKEKGILSILLETKGKTAHAARPWLGDNAFDNLLHDYAVIKEFFYEESPDHWHKTMVLTKCETGNGSSNMVPGKASATFDIRLTEHDDPDELIANLQQKICGNITVIDKAPMFYAGKSPYIELLHKHSGNAEFGFEHGASDARFLTERNIPGIIWGAEGEMSQHTDDEHIVLDSFYTLYHRLNAFLKKVREGKSI